MPHNADLGTVHRVDGMPKDEGRRICVCMKVHAGTLRRAIQAGARSLEDLGHTTMAGTGCGTCRTDLQELLGEGGVEDP